MNFDIQSYYLRIFSSLFKSHLTKEEKYGMHRNSSIIFLYSFFFGTRLCQIYCKCLWKKILRVVYFYCPTPSVNELYRYIIHNHIERERMTPECDICYLVRCVEYITKKKPGALCEASKSCLLNTYMRIYIYNTNINAFSRFNVCNNQYRDWIVTFRYKYIRGTWHTIYKAKMI